jgi:flagellar assembly factor FliW
MIIETSRFGPLEVDETRLITFERGLLGFPDTKEYALVQTGEESGFYWLQAVEDKGLAFVVCDPRLFVPDYRAPVKLEELEPIGLNNADQAQVFIIVNKVDELLTGNLQGPLVVNVENRQARQLVLSDKRFSTRHPLIRLDKRESVMGRTA